MNYRFIFSVLILIQSSTGFAFSFNDFGDFWDETRDSLEEGINRLGDDIENGGKIIANGQILTLSFPTLLLLDEYFERADIEIPKLSTKKNLLGEDIRSMKLNMPTIKTPNVSMKISINDMKESIAKIRLSKSDRENLKKAGRSIAKPFEDIYQWGKDHIRMPSTPTEKCAIRPSLKWPKRGSKSDDEKVSFQHCEYLKMDAEAMSLKTKLDELSVSMRKTLIDKNTRTSQMLNKIEQSK